MGFHGCSAVLGTTALYRLRNSALRDLFSLRHSSIIFVPAAIIFVWRSAAPDIAAPCHLRNPAYVITSACLGSRFVHAGIIVPASIISVSANITSSLQLSSSSGGRRVSVAEYYIVSTGVASTSVMARAGQYAEQRFGNAEASDGGFLFQGHVSGPLHIHREPTSSCSPTADTTSTDLLKSMPPTRPQNDRSSASTASPKHPSTRQTSSMWRPASPTRAQGVAVVGRVLHLPRLEHPSLELMALDKLT